MLILAERVIPAHTHTHTKRPQRGKRNPESYLEKLKCELKLENEKEIGRQRKNKGGGQMGTPQQGNNIIC